MPGRYPEDLNLYPWLQDINWQPDRKRPRASWEKSQPQRSDKLQFLYDFSRLFIGENGKYATVFPHEEAVIQFDEGVSFEVIPTRKRGICRLVYTRTYPNTHELTYFNNTFSLPAERTSQLELPISFESGNFYPFYCKNHPEDKDDKVIFVVEPFN